MRNMPAYRRKPGLRPRTFRWPHTCKYDRRSDSTTLSLQYFRRCARRTRTKWSGVTEKDYLGWARLTSRQRRISLYYCTDREGQHSKAITSTSVYLYS